jgi:hypothetical protein
MGITRHSKLGRLIFLQRGKFLTQLYIYGGFVRTPRLLLSSWLMVFAASR